MSRLADQRTKTHRALRFLQRAMGKHLDDLLSSASNLHLLTDGA
jgi:hypothetical protein